MPQSPPNCEPFGAGFLSFSFGLSVLLFSVFYGSLKEIAREHFVLVVVDGTHFAATWNP